MAGTPFSFIGGYMGDEWEFVEGDDPSRLQVIIIYQWNTEMEKFVEIGRHAPNSLGISFNDALDSAETLILENGDLAAAISILNTIANEYEPIDDAWWQTTLPKTLYLLGLAHEIEGNEAQAVAAYWRLWRDYPISPYALMAAAKLEEKT